MIILVLAAAVISSILCLPAWWHSHRRQYLYPWEVALPSVPVLLWVFLTYFGVGPQSLGNIIEIPLLVGVFTATVYLKSFAFPGWSISRRAGALFLAAAAVLAPLMIRLSFPMLPE
jgi:hypothetical protein